MFNNILRPRQNGREIPDDIFKCIFLNENIAVSISISLKFVSKGLIDNMAALVQIMAWHRSGDKPLSEPMMVSLLTPICVIRPQWVKIIWCSLWYLMHITYMRMSDHPTLCTCPSPRYDNGRLTGSQICHPGSIFHILYPVTWVRYN